MPSRLRRSQLRAWDPARPPARLLANASVLTQPELLYQQHLLELLAVVHTFNLKMVAPALALESLYPA
jgi:hypothetical protein